MEELETQAQDELDAMISGTNDTQETETEEETDWEVSQEETETESEEDWEEKKPKTKKEKTEDRFKKILSKKNDLATRVAELENTLADKDFYWDRPQAIKYKDEIDSLLKENPNLSREFIFNSIAGRENLSSKPKGLLWKSKAPEAKKWVEDMTSKEMESYIKENDVINQLMS